VLISQGPAFRKSSLLISSGFSYLYVILGVVLLIVVAELVYLFYGSQRANEITSLPSLEVEQVFTAPTPGPTSENIYFNKEKLEKKLPTDETGAVRSELAPFVKGLALSVVFSGTVIDIGAQEPSVSGEDIKYVIIIGSQDGEGMKVTFSKSELASGEITGVAGVADIEKGDFIELTVTSNLLDDSKDDRIIIKIRKQ
jgi:hypothetical protein